MPALPPTIFVPPSAGAPPAAAAPIHEAAPAGKRLLILSGVATAGVNGTLVYAGLNDGKAAWSTDGTLVSGAANTIVRSASGVWSVVRGSSYSATKASAAATPEGLTAWTVGTGSGSPTVTAAAVSPGTSVFSPPAAPSPTAAAAVFTRPEQKGLMVISGASTTGVNGPLIYAGTINGKPCWTTDGTMTIGNPAVRFTSLTWATDPAWVVDQFHNGSPTYQAVAISSANYPDGLTFGTPLTGTGVPVVTAGAVNPPPAVFVP